MTDRSKAKTPPRDWIELLNEQTEWSSALDIVGWFSEILRRPAKPDKSACRELWDTLTYIRSVLYAIHFERKPDLTVLNKRLERIRFAFHSEPIGSLPRFRAQAESNDDSSLLRAFADTLLVSFAQDFARLSENVEDFKVIRCEGLYRDANLNRLGAAPDIADEEEVQWRKEIEVLVEKELENSATIHRCADLFVANSRSRFCSDHCRTNTFQVVKQLVNPVYLAAKQKRYREKKR